MIFMDEIDGICSKRDEGRSDDLSNEMKSVLLQEIQLIKEIPGVYLVGASNRIGTYTIILSS